VQGHFTEVLGGSDVSISEMNNKSVLNSFLVAEAANSKKTAHFRDKLKLIVLYHAACIRWRTFNLLHYKNDINFEIWWFVLVKKLPMISRCLTR
jgi:hypothetical protein